MFCSGAAAACQKFGTVVPLSQGPGLSREAVGIYFVVRDSLFSLGYWLVAAFLFWRRSDDRMALLATSPLAPSPSSSISALLAPFLHPGGSRPLSSLFSAPSATTSSFTCFLVDTLSRVGYAGSWLCFFCIGCSIRSFLPLLLTRSLASRCEAS